MKRENTGSMAAARRESTGNVVDARSAADAKREHEAREGRSGREARDYSKRGELEASEGRSRREEREHGKGSGREAREGRCESLERVQRVGEREHEAVEQSGRGGFVEPVERVEESEGWGPVEPVEQRGLAIRRAEQAWGTRREWGIPGTHGTEGERGT